MTLVGLALLILAGIAMTAEFGAQRPKPNMVAYVQEKDRSYWVTLGTDIGGSRAALLDEWTGQFFPRGGQETFFSPAGAYAPDLQFPVPSRPGAFRRPAHDGGPGTFRHHRHGWAAPYRAPAPLADPRAHCGGGGPDRGADGGREFDWQAAGRDRQRAEPCQANHDRAACCRR
ncbi:MAG: hypothetical protein MZV70_49480 [Desulfobacterales bacterium]|nr:hypothetical protein [Desulfobacterales bacterium]